MVENGFDYDYLHLKNWPFNIVPDDESIKYWAGRKKLKQKVDQIIRRASRIPSSRLTLFWAWFGSGKSHTLRHIEWRCKNEKKAYRSILFTQFFQGKSKMYLIFINL